VKFATDPHVMRFSICELPEDRPTESHTLLADINEFLSILSTVLSDMAENRAHVAAEHLWSFVKSDGGEGRILLWA
jgi:hypothetical protein